MRYYRVEYTDNIPAGFGGVAKGPFIKILTKYRHDLGLLEHEKTHARQWWAWFLAVTLVAGALSFMVDPTIGLALMTWGPFMQQSVYRICRPYRQWSEVQAYRVQLGAGRYGSSAFAVNALVKKYNLRLTPEKAKRLLRI